jgi:hypothetical protein
MAARIAPRLTIRRYNAGTREPNRIGPALLETFRSFILQ